MSNEKILLVGRKDSAKFDQPLRELGCTVSRVDSFAAAEGLQDYKLVIADAKALKECEDEGAWPAERRNGKPALIVSLSGSDEIPEWARRHIAGCLSQEVSRGQLSVVLQAVAAQRRQQTIASRFARIADCAELAGSSLAAERLRETVRNLALTHATVLVYGECGTDKSGVATALHRQSPWADQVLCHVDCAAAPEAVEAELFGKAPAVEGALQLAAGGTLVLHEIGRLSAGAQEKLMQYFETECTGANEDDARLIATTSEDLEERCKAGAFREDLFLWLNIGPISICPLRERKSDLRDLAEHFRTRIGSQYGSEAVAFSPAACEALENYDWPGNISELGHVIGRAVILASGDRVIEPVHLRIGSETVAQFAGSDALAALKLEDVERQHIFRVLERCQWNRTHAAAKLGISIRTLRNKLREYRMTAVEEAEQQEAA